MRTAIDIEDQLRSLVAQRLGAQHADIGDAASLIEDFGADSLDLVCLIIAIEEEFGIDIPDEDAEQIVTMKQLLEYVTFAAAAKDFSQRRQIDKPLLTGHRHP